MKVEYVKGAAKEQMIPGDAYRSMVDGRVVILTRSDEGYRVMEPTSGWVWEPIEANDFLSEFKHMRYAKLVVEE